MFTLFPKTQTRVDKKIFLYFFCLLFFGVHHLTFFLSGSPIVLTPHELVRTVQELCRDVRLASSVGRGAVQRRQSQNRGRSSCVRVHTGAPERFARQLDRAHMHRACRAAAQHQLCFEHHPHDEHRRAQSVPRTVPDKRPVDRRRLLHVRRERR